MDYQVIGIDPGLIDTGVVGLRFFTEPAPWNTDTEGPLQMHVATGVFKLSDPDEEDRLSKLFTTEFPDFNSKTAKIIIEAYRPRSNFTTDVRMIELIKKIRMIFPSAKTLNNTGVIKLVTTEFLKEFDLWDFADKTHHQDLRSAVRIALLYMLKEEEGNKILSDLLLNNINPLF